MSCHAAGYLGKNVPEGQAGEGREIGGEGAGILESGESGGGSGCRVCIACRSCKELLPGVMSGLDRRLLCADRGEAGQGSHCR